MNDGTEKYRDTLQMNYTHFKRYRQFIAKTIFYKQVLKVLHYIKYS